MNTDIYIYIYVYSTLPRHSCHTAANRWSVIELSSIRISDLIPPHIYLLLQVMLRYRLRKALVVLPI